MSVARKDVFHPTHSNTIHCYAQVYWSTFNRVLLISEFNYRRSDWQASESRLSCFVWMLWKLTRGVGVLFANFLFTFWLIFVYFSTHSRHHYEKLPWTLVPMHPVSDDPIAAPIDPGIPQRSFTEKDFEGEKSWILWAHMPCQTTGTESITRIVICTSLSQIVLQKRSLSIVCILFLNHFISISYWWSTTCASLIRLRLIRLICVISVKFSGKIDERHTRNQNIGLFVNKLNDWRWMLSMLISDEH